MILVMGSFRVAPEHIDALLPLARKVAVETRAEQGCIQYSYAQDIDDPALFHVSERWTDRAALAAHARSAHMAEWVKARAGLGFHDRVIWLYAADDGEAI
ncbi:antibiotic biosynthesis monooxygenase [Novosphingobium fuchskuhlense]|uniref:Antibiotic biosynthesis monooxygenase n=1 Tax=Novosphingobium fuchskuhlense TaxID=1117702 RepID=A0A117UXY8_9SPHN|nr:putative quinol monooxygenase [Novosphingobium fuchskuhlense]KUR72931.1 antibiotic biosynthesis monooxygenase [Novosphingobium fuchskuhlense]